MSKRPEITVTWSGIRRLHNLHRYDDPAPVWLYAIVGQSKRVRSDGTRRWRVFYIGQSERPTVHRLADSDHAVHRIRESHERNWELYVRAGEIQPPRRVVLDKSLVDDVEAAQIHFHHHYHPEGLFNTQHTVAYLRRAMVIRNISAHGVAAGHGILHEIEAESV